MKPEKIDPTLLGLLEDLDQQGAASLTAYASMLGFEQLGVEGGIPSVNTFLRCEDGWVLDDLKEIGVRVHSIPRSGRARRDWDRPDTGRAEPNAICTATVPMVALSALSDHDLVYGIEPARYLQLAMDVACGVVNVPKFRTTRERSGKQVVIGIVDSGIDSDHPAFAGRIDRLWDQTIPGSGVQENEFLGRELTGANLTQSADKVGHGTHVASIAAGHDQTFEGVAPEATLVIVKTTLQNAHIGDGVRYIFRVAEELGLPAVVNLSLGGHADGHDGADSLSDAIDGEVGPGQIVCCAAGNEGDDNIHGFARVGAGATELLSFVVPANKVGIAALNGWYDRGSALDVSVVTPGGVATPWQALIGPGSPTSVAHTVKGARIRINTPAVTPGNDDINFRVEILGPGLGTPVTGGTWTLRLRHNSGPATDVHVWAIDDAGSVEFSGSAVHDGMKIGSPGAAANAVTVASYTTKQQWTDSTGLLHQVDFPLNEISPFSSAGPLRRGAAKPDIAGPGAMIAAALSQSSAPPARMKLSDAFRVNMGTSMATPFVTGLVALMLEKNPTLNPAEVKKALAAACSIPGREAGAFDPKWGFGRIKDALDLP